MSISTRTQPRPSCGDACASANVRNPVSDEPDGPDDDSYTDALYVKPEILQKLEAWAAIDAPTAEEAEPDAFSIPVAGLTGAARKGSARKGSAAG